MQGSRFRVSSEAVEGDVVAGGFQLFFHDVLEDHEEAEFYFGYARKEYEGLGVSWRLAPLHLSQYELALARGRLGRAKKHFEAALVRARKVDDRPTLSRIFRLQGERLLASGDSSRAERCFRNALVALR